MFRDMGARNGSETMPQYIGEPSKAQRMRRVLTASILTPATVRETLPGVPRLDSVAEYREAYRQRPSKSAARC